MLNIECPVCEDCSIIFSDKKSLIQHLIEINTNHLCPICGDCCGNIEGLIYHLQMICHNNDEQNADENTVQNNTIVSLVSTNGDWRRSFIKGLCIDGEMMNPEDIEHNNSIKEYCQNDEQVDDTININSSHTNQNNPKYENSDDKLKDMVVNKIVSQRLNWIKWENGYFFTERKHVLKNRFNVKMLEETSNKTYFNYTNNYIIDEIGDKFYDIPIYLFNDCVIIDFKNYFRIEVRQLLYTKEKIRIIRMKSSTNKFGIEQILFKSIPSNPAIIPILEDPLDNLKYEKMENIDNCLFLFWMCTICKNTSYHWSELNMHNCKEKSTTEQQNTNSYFENFLNRFKYFERDHFGQIRNNIPNSEIQDFEMFYHRIQNFVVNEELSTPGPSHAL